MRTRTVLQVPMPLNLRSEASAVAEEMGFSSLQEVVRLLLKKLSVGRLTVEVEDKPIPLSVKNEKRYLKMNKNFKSGKEVIYEAKDVDDLVAQLNGKKNLVRAKIS